MIALEAGYALVVDDEPANRDFAERLLQMAAYKVAGSANAADELKVEHKTPNLKIKIIDMELPDSNGVSLIRKLRLEHPDAVLVMATMHDDRALMAEAFAAGCDIFLVKPHGFMELFRRLQQPGSQPLRKLIIDQYGPRPYRG